MIAVKILIHFCCRFKLIFLYKDGRCLVMICVNCLWQRRKCIYKSIKYMFCIYTHRQTLLKCPTLILIVSSIRIKVDSAASRFDIWTTICTVHTSFCKKGNFKPICTYNACKSKMQYHICIEYESNNDCIMQYGE